MPPTRATAPEAASQPEHSSSWLDRLHALPTLAAIALLGGVGYWGHRTEWTFYPHPTVARGAIEAEPTFTVDAPAAATEWCAAHQVSACPLCRPTAAELATPPEPSPQDRDRAQRALAVRDRTANDPKCAARLRPMRFASAAAMEKAGVAVAPVWRNAVVETIPANGELAFDPTLVARLTARTSGVVWKTLKRVGDRVAAGEVVGYLDALEVGKAKAELLQAVVHERSRAKALLALKDAPVSAQQKLEAEATHREASVRLRSSVQSLLNFGFQVQLAEWKQLDTAALSLRLQGLGMNGLSGDEAASLPATLLPIRSPLEGVVIQADLVAGETAEAGKLLFVIADPRRLWLTLHTPAEDLRWLKLGQAVRFRPDGGPTLASELSWIGAAADERTRTVPLRAAVANPNGQWRAGTLGSGDIVLRDEPEAIVVPKAAVHSVAGCSVVFVRDKGSLKPDAPKVFHPRAVRLGAASGEEMEIIAGLWPGEIVAAGGSSLLANELRKPLPSVKP